MAGAPCPQCGAPRVENARYCGRCGRAFPWTTTNVPTGGSISPLRFQVDPQTPAPRRDPRYVLIVVGLSLLVLGVLFLAVSAIVGGAVSAADSGCGGSGCGVNPGPWFLWVGLPFVALGTALLLGGIAWALR